RPGQMRDARDVVAEEQGVGRVEVILAAEVGDIWSPGIAVVSAVPAVIATKIGKPAGWIARVDALGARPVREIGRRVRGDVEARVVAIESPVRFDDGWVVRSKGARQAQDFRRFSVPHADIAAISVLAATGARRTTGTHAAGSDAVAR